VKRPPAWLIGLAELPFGIVCGFVITALPFLLTRAGVSVDRAATVSATVMSPTFWGFLVTPIVDVGLSRRAYTLLTLILAAACETAGIWQLSAAHLEISTALLLIAELAIVIFSCASFGWLSEFVTDEIRGEVGGWINATNLGGGALGSLLVMQVARTAPLSRVGMLMGALVLLPGLLFLLFPAPPPSKIGLREMFTGTVRNIWAVTRRRECLVGFALFLSPASAAAAINLFSGLGKDFRTPEQTVIWVTGAGCAIAGTIGSIGSGYLVDRVNRYYAYLAAGILCALTAAIMALAPQTAATLAAGALAYNAITSLAYAAFTALGFQLVGKDNPVAGTQFALFGAAANAAVVYMTWTDGPGYRLWGATGLLATDAAASICAAVPLLFLVRHLLRRASNAPSRSRLSMRAVTEPRP